MKNISAIDYNSINMQQKNKITYDKNEIDEAYKNSFVENSWKDVNGNYFAFYSRTNDGIYKSYVLVDRDYDKAYDLMEKTEFSEDLTFETEYTDLDFDGVYDIIRYRKHDKTGNVVSIGIDNDANGILDDIEYYSTQEK